MTPDEANVMGTLIAGMVASQVALSKFLISEKVISQDALVAHLEKTVAALTSELTDVRSLIPLQNLIVGIQMERSTTTFQ